MIGDIVVLLPLVVLQGWLTSHSRELAIAIEVPMVVLYSAYTIYGHGRFGQTVGKYLVGIRVLRVSGSNIGWREAWLRSSLDIVFACLSALSTLVALSQIPDAQYYGVGMMQRAANLNAYNPSWLDWVAIAANIWIWSEVLIILFNKKRRSLHDFIAGTVVVSDAKTSQVGVASVLPA